MELFEPWRAMITLCFLALFTVILIVEYDDITSGRNLHNAGWFYIGAVLGIIAVFSIFFLWKYDHGEKGQCCKLYSEKQKQSCSAVSQK